MPKENGNAESRLTDANPSRAVGKAIVFAREEGVIGDVASWLADPMVRDVPPTGDRIKAAQKNIQELLKAKPEYVVSTSEFSDVKTRVTAMHNRRKIDPTRVPQGRVQRCPDFRRGWKSHGGLEEHFELLAEEADRAPERREARPIGPV